MTADEVKAKASMFKKWGILSPSGAEAAAIGLFAMEDVSVPRHQQVTSQLSACLFIGAIAMVAIGVVMRRKSRRATPQDDEEPLE